MRDYALADLEDFKAGFDGNFEDAVLDADQQAQFEELESYFAEMDTQYNLAAVAQQNENAAELAKVKQAEKDALMEERAEKEIQRGIAEEAKDKEG